MCRSLIAAVICLATTANTLCAEGSSVDRQPTSIAPQELAHALQALARDRNVQLIYRSELVNDRRTDGASGVLTLDEVLQQLLSGTGLMYRYLDSDAITIVRTQ